MNYGRELTAIHILDDFSATRVARLNILIRATPIIDLHERHSHRSEYNY